MCYAIVLLHPAELNRGDTLQDKHVKEAKSKCRTIASLLTDSPNPHSKGVLMFKKRRQRSKKYTLTSFGSVDEDRRQDSQEEDSMFPGSESEVDEDGFSSVPDPTWDSDCLDMLDKRATAGSEGRGDGLEDAPSPGLSDTTGKGAQLFEQQRKRAAEHAKKVEAAKSQPPPQSQIHLQTQPNFQSQQLIPLVPTALQQETQPLASQAPVTVGGMSYGDLFYTAVSTASMVMSPPAVASKQATASVTILTSPAPPAETPLPELPASNVLNRTARPFTPGFISIRAATAPVAFRPPITKATQRPASAAVASPQFSTASELAINASSVMSQRPTGPPLILSSPSCIPRGPFAPTFEVPSTTLPSSTSVQTMQAAPSMTSVQGPFVNVPSWSMPAFPPVSTPPTPHALMALPPAAAISHCPVSAAQAAPLPPVQVPISQPSPTQYSIVPAAPVSVVSQPASVAQTPAPGPGGRTGILLESRRRGGRPKPMFIVPDVKKNSPNPALLSMVQNLDERSVRQRYGHPPSEVYYGDAEEEMCGEAGMGRMPPPVAPKPRLIHEAPQILQAEGKGAQLFARRQSRMGMYVVDTPPETPYQQEITSHYSPQFLDSQNPSLHPQWKYSPNVRAPPPIGYNPLLVPSLPAGPQRDTSKIDSRGRGGTQREGIKALDFMRRQPYQLNSAMFNYGGSVANLSAMPSYQAQRQHQGVYTTMVGSTLTPPRQIPIKTARVLEVKRFSTPTPMSAPTLTPKVIAPRSSTSLGERMSHAGMTSPPFLPFTPSPAPLSTPAPTIAQTPTSPPSHIAGLPCLPKFSSTPVPNSVPTALPTPYTPASYTTGLQAAKQFQSAPELSILASLPSLKPKPVQVPKPRFVATKGGIKPRVWRPGGQCEQ